MHHVKVRSSKLTFVSLAIGFNGEIASSSKKRVAIGFFNDFALPNVGVHAGTEALIGTSIGISANSTGLFGDAGILSIEKAGSIVQGYWTAFNGSGAISGIWVLEVFEEERDT